MSTLAVCLLLAMPIPTPHTWKNQPVSHSFENGRLTIAAGKSTDWFISPSDGKQTASAPILLFTPARDFTLTAKVTAPLEKQWDAGALYVFLDDKNWAKLAFEKSVYQEPTVVSVVTKGVSDDCNSVVLPPGSVWFRIARVGDGIGFFYSTDGAKWKMVRTFTLGPAAALQAGFSAQSPIGPGAKAEFTEIRYAAETIKDFFAGQ